MGKLSFIVGALAVLRLIGHFTDPILSRAEVHRVVGEPVRAHRDDTSPASLRIVSWNIAQGINFEEIRQALRRIDADVVLLQEADIDCRRSGNRNVPRELAHALSMNWVAAGEFQEIGESMGGKPAITTQSVLSKFPIESTSVIRFRNQSLLRWRLSPIQPRRGARIALKATTAGVQFYNAHMESGGQETLRTRQLLELIDDYRRSEKPPTVIAGDFNNIPAVRSPMFPPLTASGFSDALGEAPRRTSANNRHPIDWIFVNGFSAEGMVLDTGRASDHYPVVAYLKAAAPRPGARERSLHTETMRTP